MCDVEEKIAAGSRAASVTLPLDTPFSRKVYCW